VVVKFPGRAGKDDETLSASRALFEACPGRVSKRFSVGQTERGYWLASSVGAILSATNGDVAVGADELFPERVLVRVVEGIPIYQPLAVDLSERPVDVSDSSNARWEWQSELECLGSGSPLPVFLNRSFAQALGPVEAHLHREGGGIRVLRYASTARYETNFRDGRNRRGQLRLEAPVDPSGTHPEALGFEQTVDGIRLNVGMGRLATESVLDDVQFARLRPEFFLDVLKSDEIILSRAGPFMAEWLWQTSLAMLVATAVVNRCGLRDAQVHLRGRRPQAAARVLDRIFGGLPADDSDDDPTGSGALAPVAGSAGTGKARQRDRLLSLWGDPQVLACVEAAEAILWSAPPQPAFNTWLQRRHLATIAQAVCAAAVDLVPDVAEDDLIVDVVTQHLEAPCGRAREGDQVLGVEVLLTETGPGGLGQIEAIATHMRLEPEAFEDAFRRALDHCPREATAEILLHVLESARRPQWQVGLAEVGAALARVRAARGHVDADLARAALSAALDEEGIEPTRDALVAVVGRLARPGSAPVTDALARGLNREWRRHEQRLGTSIDPRVFAYLCVERRGIRRRLAAFLRRLAGGVVPTDHQLYAAVREMMLPGCHDSCPECLDQGHPFDGLAKPSRDLTRSWLDLDVARLDVDASFSWLDRARALLRDQGRVAVCSSASLIAHAGRGVQMLLAAEIEREFVMAPISLAGVMRSPRGWTMLLRLRAAEHV
jgi:hypothetical protein